jgi:hypothetical protein
MNGLTGAALTYAPVDVAIPLLRITGGEVYVCGDFEDQRVIRP